MGWMDDAMVELRPWIGRVRVIEDDIAMPMVRRVAAMLDLDPDSFRPGIELPPHWFSMFFADIARQSDLRRGRACQGGVVLPPIPMPRRMGAGRRLKVMGRLRAAEPAVRKVGGRRHRAQDAVARASIFVLTMRNTIEQARQGDRRRRVRRDLPRGHAAGTEDHRDRAGAGADRPRLGRHDAAVGDAGVPLLRDHLERPPHPLRRRLRARRGGLSAHGAEWRPDHAADDRRGAQARAAEPRAAGSPRGWSTRSGSATRSTLRGEASRRRTARMDSGRPRRTGTLCGEMELEFERA